MPSPGVAQYRLVRVLPLADQVELLRMLAPPIMAELDEKDRADLITAINEAILHHALHRS